MLRHYGGRQTARVEETEREKGDKLTALNYRADYSGRMAPGLLLWLTFTVTHTHTHTIYKYIYTPSYR